MPADWSVQALSGYSELLGASCQMVSTGKGQTVGIVGLTVLKLILIREKTQVTCQLSFLIASKQLVVKRKRHQLRCDIGQYGSRNGIYVQFDPGSTLKASHGPLGLEDKPCGTPITMPEPVTNTHNPQAVHITNHHAAAQPVVMVT
ncbi:hypothetical protein PSTG_17213 [Puccinia striiformis f. sp. tritici PST-78]|uniref:Uncharacterized protein n=1 Tax=Puccinia striiformis f. sp. tritici PST-78 TaxID=1165861 RepID=A0A0L0UQK8_9BASI|nr:hypothetical protein PSTG_17213 [Puccinia striiformis f. sp. tritici PST-78]